MTKDRLSVITKRYNKEREKFNFPTVPASSEGIESIIKINPSFETLPDDELVFKLASYLNHLTVGWN